MTTSRELVTRVTRLEERVDNQREDIRVISSDLSKVLESQLAIQATQGKHTLKLAEVDQKTTELVRVVAEHGQTLTEHTRLHEAHAKELATHREILAGHTKILDGHSETLDGHTQTLDGHTQTLNSHTQTLDGHTQTLNSHTQTLDKHTRMFETMFAHFGIPLPTEDHQNN